MFPKPFQNALVLTGPTGAGKTALGLDLAEKLGAEIVSMDSMALFRRMDIGTAKPSAGARIRVRHHLLDELEPWQQSSVAWWLQRAGECCRDIEHRAKRILFVGGTPLYLKALVHGLFQGPPADAALRRRLEEVKLQEGQRALHRRLAAVDPATAARLHPNDLRRIIRALEVWEVTGQPLSHWQTQWPARTGETSVPPAGPPRILWLEQPRDVLYSTINARVVEMFKSGFVEEVRALGKLPRPVSREAAQALGYKEVFAYLDGKATLEETIAQVQTRTRNFAKRQITWFRHLPGCRPVTPKLTWELWTPRS